ncbi:hypothetical protein BB559_006678, partial [Furculomyces boomerangus]
QPDAGNVVSLKCMFCIHFGRDGPDNDESYLEEKRKLTSSIKLFETFRIKIKSYLSGQHGKLWKRYLAKYTKTIPARFSVEKPLEIVIKSLIVKTIIGKLLSQPDDSSHDNFLILKNLFSKCTDPNSSETNYKIVIKPTRSLLLWMDGIGGNSSKKKTAKARANPWTSALKISHPDS